MWRHSEKNQPWSVVGPPKVGISSRSGPGNGWNGWNSWNGAWRSGDWGQYPWRLKHFPNWGLSTAPTQKCIVPMRERCDRARWHKPPRDSSFVLFYYQELGCSNLSARLANAGVFEIHNHLKHSGHGRGIIKREKKKGKKGKKRSITST